MKPTKGTGFFNNQYQPLNNSDLDNNNKTSNDPMKDALEIARLAGYASLFQLLQIVEKNENNDSFVRTYIIDGYFNEEADVRSFDQRNSLLNRVLTLLLRVSTSGDSTFEQNKLPKDVRAERQIPEDARNKPQDFFEAIPDHSLFGLSYNERLIGRKKIYVSNLWVRGYFERRDSIKKQLIRVITSNRPGPQLEKKRMELDCFVVAPPGYPKKASKLEKLFAQRYLNRDDYPSHDEAMKSLGESDSNDDYCLVKNKLGEYLCWDVKKNEPIYTKDRNRAFIFNRKAYENSLVEDIRNELLALQREVDLDNLKNKPKNCLSQLWGAFFNTNKSAWVKLTASGTGVFADVLMQDTHLTPEIFEAFFKATIEVCKTLPKASSGKMVIEIPLFGDVAEEQFNKCFTNDIKAELAAKGIQIEAGIKRDVFNFNHVDSSKYVYCASNPGDVMASAGNELNAGMDIELTINAQTVEAMMGIVSTMPQDMVWIFNFMKMLSPHNQFFTSVNNGKAVYESVAERYPNVASEYDSVNTPEKCQELFEAFVSGVREYLIDELQKAKWPKEAAEKAVNDWYQTTNFETVKQTEVFEGKSLCTKMFSFTQAANQQLNELLKQPIPQQDEEESIDLSKLGISYSFSAKK